MTTQSPASPGRYPFAVHNFLSIRWDFKKMGWQEMSIFFFTVAAICAYQAPKTILRCFLLSLPITLCFTIVALFLCWPSINHSAVCCSGSAPCLLRILLLGGFDSDQGHSRLALGRRRLLWLGLRWRCAGSC